MKIGTIGTGFIVDWFLNAVKQNEGAVAVAMYSRKKESAASLAEKYGVKKIYTDYKEMLGDEEVDTIYVASPNSLHFSYSKEALLAGKNVICEKPFTSTVKEFKELKAIALEKNLFLFEAIVTIHMPNYLAIKEHLHELGNIKMVQCNFSQYSSRYDKFLAGETPNVFNPAFSGGALSDINIYNLHFVMGLFGKPMKVHYFPNKHANGIDTSGVAILEYDGFKAVCVGCKDTKSHNISQIQGEKGYITVNSETSKCSNAMLNVASCNKSLAITQNDDALYYELKDFISIIEQQDHEACKHLLDYSEMVMEIYEAARKDGGIVFDADNN